MASYVGAIDQGATSSRFIVFDRQGEIVSIDQREHAHRSRPNRDGSSTTRWKSGATRKPWSPAHWRASMTPLERERLLAQWNKAVARSFAWVE